MLITNNLERKHGCYIAEILHSHPDLYNLLVINSTKLCSHAQPTHSTTHTHKGFRRRLADGSSYRL